MPNNIYNMRTKGPGIAPWSFYKSDPLDLLINTDNPTIDIPTGTDHPKFKRNGQQFEVKDYDKINKDNIETLLASKK